MKSIGFAAGAIAVLAPVAILTRQGGPRAPYSSNGSARRIREVVQFYDTRFEIRFTEREKLDLANFLSVL